MDKTTLIAASAPVFLVLCVIVYLVYQRYKRHPY